ncbi:hypothetical protein M514_17436 [Trichuris suis]|uniref:Uncharacterized protein n=1 Tax=Trichuris suis TaxID=68888 RepID=A0A085NLK6_9BILA|nr:hypothetical protein M514_17436 [Trichuris suis]
MKLRIDSALVIRGLLIREFRDTKDYLSGTPRYTEFANKKTADNEGRVYSEFRPFGISTVGYMTFSNSTIRRSDHSYLRREYATGYEDKKGRIREDKLENTEVAVTSRKYQDRRKSGKHKKKRRNSPVNKDLRGPDGGHKTTKSKSRMAKTSCKSKTEPSNTHIVEQVWNPRTSFIPNKKEPRNPEGQISNMDFGSFRVPNLFPFQFDKMCIRKVDQFMIDFHDFEYSGFRVSTYDRNPREALLLLLPSGIN